MRVLITGGAGFIGSNLVKHFNNVDPSTEVRVLDDLSSGAIQNLDGTQVEFTHGTILDSDLLKELMTGIDSVIHLAAIGSVPRSVAAPMPTHAANATGTLNVLEAARSEGVDHVVVASSSSVYGSNPGLPKSEFDWTRPMSPYGVSKLATEAYAIAYGSSYGMKTLAFRFFNVYGPGQPANHDYAAVIPRFIDAALSGQVLTIYGDGLQSRDFTFVDTVTSVLLEAAQTRASSAHPVNLAFGTNTTLLQLRDALAVEMGHPLAVEHIDSRPGDVRASQSDGVRLRELFPDAVPYPLDEGIRRTVGWFRSQTS